MLCLSVFFVIVTIHLSSSGIALLLMHLSKTVYEDAEKEKEFLDIAEKVCDTGRKKLHGKRVTFLCGDAGKCIKCLHEYI